MKRRRAGILCLAVGLCLAGCDVAHEYATREFSAPLEAAGGDTDLEIEVKFPAGGIFLHAAPDDLLYRAAITSCRPHAVASAALTPASGGRGRKLSIALEGRAGVFAGFGGEHNQMDLGLTPALAGTFDLDLGEGESVIDLAGLRVRRLRLKAGAGDARIVFGTPNAEPAEEIVVEGTIGDVSVELAGNANAGTISMRGGVGTLELDLGGEWRRDASIRIEASVGDLVLKLPGGGTGVRLDVGSPWKERLSAPGLTLREDAFYTDGYGEAGRRIDIRIEAGIGDLIIIEEGAG